MSSPLIFPDQAPPAITAAVKSILQPEQSVTIPAAPNVFVRIARLDTILRDGQIPANAHLAGPNGPPVVFLTIPEGIAGFKVDAVLSRVGYTADEIENLFGGGQAAAIVFRYPDAVQSLAALDGGSSSDVLKRVVRGTWENLFRTFKALAEIDESPLQFEADDRRFVASFPSWGQSRLMGVTYSHIETEGGADWRYRWLLQRLLWVTPKFLGKGWAADGNGGPGVPEYLGPNSSLSSLAAAQRLAIVSLN